VLAVHYIACDQYFADTEADGFKKGLASAPSLLSAINAPRATFDGRELYPSICDKAATLFRSLIKNHPFVDGNKRTALVTVVLFFETNGYQLKVSKEKTLDFALEVARASSREMPICRISQWFEKHTSRSIWARLGNLVTLLKTHDPMWTDGSDDMGRSPRQI